MIVLFTPNGNWYGDNICRSMNRILSRFQQEDAFFSLIANPEVNVEGKGFALLPESGF